MSSRSYIANRIGIYMSIALLTPTAQFLATLDSEEKIASVLWTQWVVVGLSAVLSALNTLRAFLDQSVARSKDESNTP